MEFKHKSVLLNETINKLNIIENGIYVDGTLGGGGHSIEIAKRLTSGSLIGIDQDEQAIFAASKRLVNYLDKVKIVRSNYSQMDKVLKDLNIDKVNGILLDLGVSSHQIDTADRGFSYMVDGQLDMRMDNRNKKTARDIVNNYSEDELFRVIKYYGEDRFAKNIAKKIVKARQEREILTTYQLNEIIDKSIPKKFKVKLGHPSKKTFQAIRIELNQELDVLKNTIDTMINLLAANGRLCIITFHSLEDRIVKQMFRENENPCICPAEFPICICHKETKGRVITKKPILALEEEIKENKRAKSAKLRVFEKIG